MFAQPDEYLTLVFSLIAIVFWYRLRTRVEMSQEIGDGVETAEHQLPGAISVLRRKARSQLLPLITESGLLVHLYLNAARDLNHIKVQGQFSSEFQVREIN